MDQPSESEVLSSGSSIFLSNGSILRRDSSETVDDTSLELGEGGGGISVGDGFSLVWDAPITGSGDFTKFGEGKLTFPASAPINYTGSTFVRGGMLEVFSLKPTSAICIGTGSSNLCQSGITFEPPVPGAGEESDALVEDLSPNPEDETREPLQIKGDEELLEIVAITPSTLADDLLAQIDLQVDLGSTSDLSDFSVSDASDVLLSSVDVQSVVAEQASYQFQQSDQLATSRTVSLLGLNQGDQALGPGSPTVEDLQSVLTGIQRKGLVSNPAILQVRFTSQVDGAPDDAFLDLTLIGVDAPVQARRVSLNRRRFASLLKALYRQLSRQEPLSVDDPASPSRQLHALLVAPILESVQGHDAETLLIAVDQGLQAVPFAALSDGTSFFGENYSFALTPSLALTPLAPSQSPSEGQLALGASEFKNLAPLPLVPQELEQLDASIGGADRYLNDAFSPQALLKGAADQRYNRVHVATHAYFRPGGPTQSLLYTGTEPMSMAQFAQLRSERSESPLDLIVLSACRTLLGDQESELGFAGLALQAGARSAIGTLWFVDDVVTSAFFVQFYRLLDQGFPKAEALQRTRALFASGAIQLEGDLVVGADAVPLLTGLTPAQRRRIAGGVQHPYLWSGIELIGSPW